jgi:uncharacterized lipoprotein YajG
MEFMMVLFALAMLAQAAAPATTPPATPAKEKPKMICRNYDVTGSLVQKQRVCRTAAAWSKAEDDQRTEADRLNQHIAAQRGN